MGAIEAVERALDAMGAVAVAVSGGIDSLTLATVAARRLGGRAEMFHSMTGSVPLEATARTREIAARLGWRLHVIDADEFSREEYLSNPVNRCYYCKQSLYAQIAQHTRAQVLSGANTDDLSDYRPGLDAAREAGARHPFVEAGIGKGEIRAMARALGLGALAEIPASPCLSSRVETGLRIVPETLRQVERAEAAVRERLPRASAVRCRVRASGLVIEIDEETLEALDTGARGEIASVVGSIFRAEPRLAAYRMGSAFIDPARIPIRKP